MVAVRNDDKKHFKMLLAEEVRLDTQDKNGWSAVHHAAYGGSEHCLKGLINEGMINRFSDSIY